MPLCRIPTSKRIIQLFGIALLLVTACKSRPAELWKFSTGAPIYASPAVIGSNLIIGSQDHFLYALDLQSGKQIWKTDLHQRIFSMPMIKNNSIYIGSGDGRFYNVDPAKGDIRWSFRTGDLIHYDACSDDTGIYFGSGDASFYKIDYSGNKLWSFKGGMKFWGDCILYKDLVITSCWDKHYYGIDRATGEVKWKVNSGIYNYGSPEIHGDQVYFATHDKLFRIDAETGKLISTTKTTYLNYVVSWKDFLWTNEKGVIRRRIDGTEDGSVAFKSNAGFRPVVTDQYLIVAGGTNELFAVSPDLKIQWTYKGGDTFRAPGIVVKGIYYTGNRDHNIYALQLPAN